jgi:nitroreductase
MKLSLDSIRKRHSTRTFDGAPLSAEEEKTLRASFAEAVPGPFGLSPRFILAAKEKIASSEEDDITTKRGGVRVGTYGLIVGPPAFVAGVVRRKPFACVDFGYCMEGVILRATELGLDTCWIGGVFDRGGVVHALAAGEDEFAPATTPVGHAAVKPSIQEILSTAGTKKGARRKFDELFFEAGPHGAWERLEHPGEWNEVLEAVRIGPSARNMQPWRIVLDRRSGEALHLVMEEDRFYNNILGDTKLQELDMGIAMRHVDVAAAELGITGRWKRLDPPPIELKSPRRYIATFVRV